MPSASPRQHSGKEAGGNQNPSRQKRPNYHEIHARPLPLKTRPLPVFIPHNPISYLGIVFALFAGWLGSPDSHASRHKAYFSAESQSVHVTHPASIRALWEQGFFGKGSLSRSEPQWFGSEQRRLGVEEVKTSAMVTQSRRDERKRFKLERANAQREAIEQQLRQEKKLDTAKAVDPVPEEGIADESCLRTGYRLEGSGGTADAYKSSNGCVGRISNASRSKTMPELELRDLEHLQLTLEEAFFLTYALGILDVVRLGHDGVSGTSNETCSTWLLLRLYCMCASLPVAEDDATTPDHMAMEPDNSFMLNYVVYHHFRSLGWVVRPGIKFAVDYLLYQRGPAFTHAEFAILIVPSFTHAYWGERCKGEQGKDWWWLHRVNRVQTQVMKTLLLVYVEVPPPWDDSTETNIGAILSQYKVREFVVKRWSPSRNRD